MPIIARFSVDIHFGKKADFFKLDKKWEPLSKELGFPKPEVLIGSIGAPESRVEINHRFENMAALEAVWSRLGDPRVAEYQRDMAPYIVPGSHRWDILRIHER